MKRTFLFFIAGFVVIVVLFSLSRARVISIPFPVSHKTQYSIALDQAPKETIRGSVLKADGEIGWISRTATVEAPLKRETPIQQGESVQTGKNGSISIGFADKATVMLLADSKFEIIQSLPTSLVFSHIKGDATYEAHTGIPVSVKIKHLVAVIDEAAVSISSTDDPDKVIIKAIRGSVQLGFNDLDYKTIRIDVGDGQTYVYDDASRTGEIKETDY